MQAPPCALDESNVPENLLSNRLTLKAASESRKWFSHDVLSPAAN